MGMDENSSKIANPGRLAARMLPVIGRFDLDLSPARQEAPGGSAGCGNCRLGVVHRGVQSLLDLAADVDQDPELLGGG